MHLQWTRTDDDTWSRETDARGDAALIEREGARWTALRVDGETGEVEHLGTHSTVADAMRACG